MQLHDVDQGIHKYKKRKRVGRGTGSGHGKTASKGNKGHSSRQGFKQNPLFEGGQMPLARRVPKRGFVNGAFKKDFAIVNLDRIVDAFEAGAVVQAAGVTDILTKSYGSTNKLNLVKAALDALTQLRTKDEVARLRGVAL